MGGIGFQQLCIFFFLFLAIRFHKKLLQQPRSESRRRGLTLLIIEYAVVGLITVRIIFRLIEYSSGITSSIPKHEAFQYVFDSTPMLIALVLFNAFHPGRLMPGSESNLPSRKVRKVLKKEGKQPLGRTVGDYLLPKYETPLSGEEVRGKYERLATPSPPRGNSFDHGDVEAR